MSPIQNLKVWITYAFEDKKFVENIERFFDRLGVDILNRVASVQPGDNIVSSMSQSISKADLVIIILSKHTNEKQWFNIELGLAFNSVTDSSYKKLLPIILDKNVQLPPFIGQFQALYSNDTNEIERQLEEILFSIYTSKLIGSETKGTHELFESINNRGASLTKEDLYEFEKREYEYKIRSYEEEASQRQKLVSIAVLTSAFTAIISLSIAVYIAYIDSNKTVSEILNAPVTINIPYSEQIATILIAVLISTGVNLFLNRLNKK